MTSELERDVMTQAIAEARLARPSPNPRVGAAIVRDGKLVALGHHEAAGGPHAEVQAIANAGADAAGATLYVTLEPCNHHGRTGPCTDAILEAGIARVVVGYADPAPHVPAADKLRAAGVEVEMGVLEEECAALVVDFEKHIKTGLPYVTLKAAITLDGKIATRTGDSKWITGKEARTEAHRMRADADAILVGIGTVLADDPALTVRHVEGPNPLRVVLDADLRTPEHAAVLGEDADAPGTLIFHAEDADEARARSLARPGVELVRVPRAAQGVDLPAVLRALGQRGVLRLLVEGGGHVHGAFLDLADHAALFVAPRIIGDADALSFAAGAGVESIGQAWQLRDTRVRTVGTDLLVTGDFERNR